MASLDHEDGGISHNLEVHSQVPEDDDDHAISRQKQSVCSSSLSDSSLDESVVLENDENGLHTLEPKHAVNDDLPTMSYSSDFGYPSPVWSFQSTSVTQYPPSQMMARPGYDPNRIPLSVFSSRATNPLGWSHTSNESLFSIQAGNNSFARVDDSISKSTALYPVEEAVPSNCADIEGHSDSVSTRVTWEEVKDSLMVMHCESVETLAETTEDNRKEAIMVPTEEAKNITSVSYRSEDSRMSNRSFQFPVLAIEGGRKSKIRINSEKALEPPSPEAEKTPNPRPRNRWYLPSCCSSR
ncbi:uncharacterized protein LOC129307364 [Prosopis cineraria]|uniref:uncharacterized protein LOC129307364 n=1 Tax=Prosopis cineraria TaxID=364024 RepID=UPI00240F2B83|nr:uncharacterized protein LOC129307364 [Prosopis cineraria]XP_054804274.1 uncharacterized protein LOC129307364 [Prosopis cineraria]XP_054804275.1 uncharacterized protein LOC129307364 [Prosopis cineraria]XP_054804276.1 uncharacterized protein LOC129307364 [Prosopis cineraria]